MKTAVALLASLGLAHGFAPLILPKPRTTTDTALKMGFLDNMFKPIHGHGTGEGHFDEMMKEEHDLLQERKIAHHTKKNLKKKYAKKEGWLESMLHTFHGHGSGEDNLDDMYETQKQVLYERREYYGNKDKLKSKYHNPNVDHLNEIETIKYDPATLNKKEDDAMYTDEEEGPKFKFPFGKLKP